MNNSVFFKTKLKAPCKKDCPGRDPECHSVCEKYLEYERLKKAEYDKHIKEVTPVWEMNEIEADRIVKYLKMKGRKHR